MLKVLVQQFFRHCLSVIKRQLLAKLVDGEGHGNLQNFAPTL